MTYLLEMKSITKQFMGVKVLDNVEFRLRAGTVHALVGENGAGKSTLIKCLSGQYTHDDGQIFINGEKVEFTHISQSIAKGIAVINQELSPVLERSVMENIWLGREPLKRGLVDNKKMLASTNELLERLSITYIDPKEIMKNYTIAKMQMIEIIKAISYNAKILVMDEPTSSLTTSEVEQLFEMIDILKQQNVGIIYISHKMDEIMRIADDITVIRDGKYISTDAAKEVSINTIINRMVGRELTEMFPKSKHPIGEVILKVENLSAQKAFRNVSFEVRKGEILGMAGLVGSGRTEMAEALYGMRNKTGNVYINGQKVTIQKPSDALAHKMVMLTEDRRATGIVPVLSVGTNIVLANYAAYLNKAGLLNEKAMRADIAEYMKKLNVKAFSPDIQIQKLSGGNQQKALIARWLLLMPDILILDEPTRGIDVGAKAEIYALISQLAGAGKAIIMISSELPEILGMSDRVLIMHEGQLTGILDNKELDQEVIMQYATKTM